MVARRVILLGGILLVAAVPQGAISEGSRFTEYTVPTAKAYPTSICLGSDGNLWFPEQGAIGHVKIGRITPQGVIKEFPIGNQGAAAIIAGPDGNLWFTSPTGGSLFVMRVDGTFLAIYPAASSGASETLPAGVFSVTVGPDGNLWYTESYANRVGRMTPSGTFVEFPLGAAGYPGSIAVGPDAALWFTEDYRVARISLTGEIKTYSLPAGIQPLDGTTTGPDGRLWFTQPFTPTVVRMSVDGTFSLFTIPDGGQAGGWVVGPDGALWFGDDVHNAIGRITTSGEVTEYAIPTPKSLPGQVVVGPDGALWFTETVGNKIGRFEIPSLGSAAIPTLSMSVLALFAVSIACAGLSLLRR
jgi:virginiamycin B lyase